MHCRRIVLCLLCSCQSLLAVSTPTECTASSSACSGSDAAALLQARLDMSREREQQSPTTDTHTSPGDREDQEDHEDHEDHKEDEGDKDDEGDEDGEDNDDNGSTPPMGDGKDQEDHEDNEDHKEDEGDKDDEGDEDGEDNDENKKVKTYKMPIAEARKFDAAAMKEFPDMLPMVPILFPKMVEAHDDRIASKIQNLTRDRRIRLPDGKEISYWQTLQYANRHFRLCVRKIINPKKTTSKYSNTTMAQKIQLWGVSGILRKMLCHPNFLDWIRSKTQAAITNRLKIRYFGKKGCKNVLACVYGRFEAAHTASWAGFNLKQPRWATAIAGSGMSLWVPKNAAKNGKTWWWVKLLKTYMHEQSHLMGYSHETGVPYGSAVFIGRAIKQEIASYTVYDLASSTNSNFEVL